MQEIINRHNYERFLIDFADGTLSADQHALVVLFLEENPDIAEEFENMLQIELEPSNESCNNIESLKKNIYQTLTIDKKNYEHYFIAYAEGDLNSEEMKQVEDFVADNYELEKEFTLYQNIVLKIDDNEQSIEKVNLRRIVLANNNSITENEFNNLCIAYYEGDLSPQDVEIINKTIEYSELAASIFNSFANIKIAPNLHIVYPNKSALKKKGIIVFANFARIGTSVAAAIAFVLLYYFSIKTDIVEPDYNVIYPSRITISNKAVNVNNMYSSNVDTIITTTIAKKDNYKNKISSIKRKKLALQNIRSISNNILLSSKPDIEMSLIRVAMQTQFVNEIDSGYYLVVADNSNNIIEKNLPASFKNTLRKLKRMFIKEKEEIKAEPPRTTIMNVAKFAIAGYNKLTENNIYNYPPSERDNISDDSIKRK